MPEDFFETFAFLRKSLHPRIQLPIGFLKILPISVSRFYDGIWRKIINDMLNLLIPF